jgi:hypothetical protein
MEREEPVPRPADHQGEAAAETTFDLDVVKLLSDALNGGTGLRPPHFMFIFFISIFLLLLFTLSFAANLYTVAPGLDRGLNFDSSVSTSFSKILQGNPTTPLALTLRST